MIPLNKYGSFLCLVILGLSFTPVMAQEKSWVSLYGSRDEGSIKLYWETFAWPQDLQGFNIKRRIVNGTDPSEWQNLNILPLVSDIEEIEDWSNQGLNEMQSIDMDSTLSRYLREGRVSLASRDDILSVLKSNNGMGSGDRIKMKTDYRLALLFDFAFIDNNIIDGIDYEYGIFSVADDGSESNKPLDVFKTTFLNPPDYQVVFQKQKQGVTLSWQLEREQFKGRSILGFYVYRRNLGSEVKTQVIDIPVGVYRETAELLVWRYLDLKADNKSNFEFGLAYVDMFQNTSDIVWVLYDADYFAEIEPPKIDSLLLFNDVDMVLKWSLPKATEGRSRGYVVELSGDAEPGKWEFHNISDTLPQQSLEFIDTVYKNYGEVYFYRVGLIDKFGRAWYSQSKSVYYMGLAKPGMVKDLKAVAEVKDGKAYVALSWQLNDDSLTTAYLLFTDELHPGVMNEIGGVGRLKGPTYKHPIPTAGGREYTLGIAPLGKFGAVGERHDVRIYVPIAKMPPLYSFEAKLEDDLSVNIRWDYPDFRELQGFELYMNGEPIAGNEKLGPNVREFTVEKIIRKDASAYVEFTMKALGENMETPMSLKKSFYIPNLELSDIMPPDSLQVQLLRDSSDLYAFLTWQKINLDSAGLSGYIFYADYYSEGSVHLMSSIPLIQTNEFLYKIPDNLRKSYTLRVAALSDENVKGRYAQVKLLIDYSTIEAAMPLESIKPKNNEQ